MDPVAQVAELTGEAVLESDDISVQRPAVIATFTETSLCIEFESSEPLRFEGDILDGGNVFGRGSPNTLGVLLLTRPEAVFVGAWVTWKGDGSPADGGVVGEILLEDGSYQVIDSLVTVADVKLGRRSTAVDLEGLTFVSTGGETCEGWLSIHAELGPDGGRSFVVTDPACDVTYAHAQDDDDRDDGDCLKLKTISGGTGKVKG